MRVGVLGIGKVGSCLLVAFARKGHNVLGYDVIKNPLNNISNTERDLIEGVKLHRIKDKIVSLEELVKNSDIIFIIVQTPSLPSGKFDIRYVEEALKNCTNIDKNKIYVVSSTVPPFTMRKLLKYTDNLYYNPLFIRLGSVIHDLSTIRFIMIGSKDGRINEKLVEFYETINPYLIRNSTFETVEVTKLMINCVQTNNISLINKIGEIYNAANADIDYLLYILDNDFRFKLSNFRPGLGYGGPCLTRDNKMMQAFCSDINVNHDIFSEIDNINNAQIDRAIKICKPYEKIGMYGIGYKLGSDITTDSQGWILVNRLKDLGKKVEVYDPYNKKLSSVANEHELANKTDIVILTLPYKTKLKSFISLWEARARALWEQL